MRVDVHNHAIPERVLELLDREPAYGVELDGYRWHGGNHVDFEVSASFRDPEAKLGELARLGLDAAVVSVAPPLFYYELDPGPGETICRAANEGLRELCAADARRLRWMAHVPLQSPVLAAETLEREAREPGCVGVEVGSSVAGTRLDAPELEPFWAAAEAHDLAVMIHPDFTYDRHPPLSAYYLGNVIGLPLETTLAIERMICAGVLGRHPGLRILLVHAGGFFPYQAGRLGHARTVRPELADAPEDPWAFLGQIWFDSITHDRGALEFLVSRVGESRVVLGTDLPFDMASPDPIGALTAAAGERRAARIAERNPLELFPGLG